MKSILYVFKGEIAMIRKMICFAFIIILVVASTAFAKGKTVRVKGEVTKSGTYRSPHHRTSPNKTKLDNWSTKGNVNPYTGKSGTVNPYKK